MPVTRTRFRARRAAGPLVALATAVSLLLAGCGYGSQAVQDTTPRASGPKTGGLDEVRIGFFANVTHATALVGLGAGGRIQKELGGTQVKPYLFNAGPSAIEALNAGSVDLTWIGPSPAVNGYVKAGGRNLRIVAGATSGGASLVVDPDRVKSVADLKGKRIATPQHGNTQDVALLNFLAERGHKVDPDSGRGDVLVVRQDNKEIPTTFQQGGIDGAWVPEPTASAVVSRGGKVLVDERDLWDDGKFVTTHLVASQRFLKEHPDVVEAVVRGALRTNAWINDNPEQARGQVNAALERHGGRPLPDEVLRPAFEAIEVTDDPLASTLREQAEHAREAGLLDKSDLNGIYDLRILDRVRKAEGLPPVDDAGLGVS
ncbi:ABC transporter substrate-binding protein [Streptomyces alkaliterrae]|uniref:ABC transporter substrate-binding protein n=1 Tax=Streptomyces alkaliterrae TaxID=2213162 RepID=A0A5P0YXK3_9ACTN|nr:ABC transporter substrate-binding protein [Streptomyces alkaliterrae]MBB1254852.1 ABC transporter substrate-binding protein [Streptomyces alkaliterrae]MBB1258734.1 ABC transporter substrate-binding protein [Streptomyces alkaliterrae]MQS03219.1 aliphatic sulfonate ABC transporter substrate-binding protein [Streptomyces alkaliterrae]